MQEFMCIGNLTRDPEESKSPQGLSVSKFGIAVKRGKSDENDFFNVVAWRGQADFCNTYLHKGNKVAIKGEVQVRTYEAKDGSKRTAVDIVVGQIMSLEKKEDAPKTEAKQPKLQPIADEQLPF